ncbi:MAG: NADPH-dependent 7-cyano-7-deazaguanine reductase QueF, partial [Methyloprofundus sp.]|nr:NADPH-dependent 7-cyano-7-deazaguanine reductase QueF [Methyloprofundus sp.]
MSETNIYQNLQQLGGKAELPEKPEQAILESVQNPQADVDYMVRFVAPEFTSLCPLTGQPDFAHLVIDYIPSERLVESKSL